MNQVQAAIFGTYASYGPLPGNEDGTRIYAPAIAIDYRLPADHEALRNQLMVWRESTEALRSQVKAWRESNEKEDFHKHLRAVAEDARQRGYAITFWSPEEVGNANADELTDIAVERGNGYLEDINGGEE
jgi:hypothetical protein